MNVLQQPLLLEIDRLTVAFDGSAGSNPAVDNVSLHLEENQVLALVGESGCGKSTLAGAVLGLLPRGGRPVQGTVLYREENVWAMNPARLRALRRRHLALVGANGLDSLDPLYSVGNQLREALAQQGNRLKAAARARALTLLEQVGLSPAEELLGKYPHQLSGGQRQRLLIALALAGTPRLLIADEPTNALDVTVQAGVVQLLRQLRQERRMSMLLISHDLASVAALAERVAVMYGGRILEQGSAEEMFYRPLHPYTKGLLAAAPRRAAPAGARLQPIPGQPGERPAPGDSCCFALRCPCCMNICLRRRPEETVAGPAHQVACWLTELG